MRFSLRLCLICLLALSLVWASLGVSARAGEGPAAERIVLCVGGGTAHVWVDASGAPVTAPHVPCSHCILAAADLTPPAFVPLARGAVTRVAASALSLPLSLVALPAPRARAPPVV